jgi:hypothetical protein
MESMATGVAPADDPLLFPERVLVTMISSNIESQVPQSGHLPIHFGA